MIGNGDSRIQEYGVITSPNNLPGHLLEASSVCFKCSHTHMHMRTRILVMYQTSFFRHSVSNFYVMMYTTYYRYSLWVLFHLHSLHGHIRCNLLYISWRKLEPILIMSRLSAWWPSLWSHRTRGSEATLNISYCNVISTFAWCSLFEWTRLWRPSHGERTVTSVPRKMITNKAYPQIFYIAIANDWKVMNLCIL